MKRSHIIAVVALAALVLVASIVSIALFTRRVQVLTGQRVECVYGHVVKDDVKTIKVRPSEASRYGVKTVKVVCDDHRRAEKLYDEAQAALKSGDYKTARDKLAEVVTLDRNFKSASAQLAEVDAGKKPAPATDTGSASAPGAATPNGGASEATTEKAGGSQPTGPVASLAGWAPDEIEGFTAEPIVADTLSLSREYRASSGDTLVIAADQVGSTAAVTEQLKSRVKLTYDKDARTVRVGSRSAYAGTDGRSVAVLAIPDGAVLVVLQIRTPGSDPKPRIDQLIGIAKTLPK